VQLNGETWQPTQDVAELKLYLCRPDVQCDRQEWRFEMMHLVPRVERAPGASYAEKSLVLTLETMGVEVRDWRRLAGMEIRADASWHAKHGHCNEGGWLRESSLEVCEMFFRESAEDAAEMVRERTWRAHDFVLRFGKRDGLAFPVELDAWLLPEEEYWRREPESPEELARFGEGPPDLRVMATAVFTMGWVALPPCKDPLALAERMLRKEVAIEGMHNSKIQWETRELPGTTEREEMREWPATVYFTTEPGRPRRRRGLGGAPAKKGD
jgi:hypothetical protein